VFPWWVASLSANAAIIGVEYFNRTATDGLVSVLPVTLPLIVVAQVCLFHSFNGAPTWLWAWGFFTVGNSLLRVGVVAWLGHEIPANWTYVAVGIVGMFLSAYVLKQGVGA